MSANALVGERRQVRVAVPWRLILGFIAVLASVGLLIVVSASVKPGTAGVPELTAPLLDGTTVRLSDYRGQVVMLNFWATWCGPCRAEMPMLQAASQQHHDQGFVVLAINNAEARPQVQSFIDSLGLHFPIALDEKAQLQHQFGVLGYPTSIFIGRDGTVFATHLGALDTDQLTEYIEAGLAHNQVNRSL